MSDKHDHSHHGHHHHDHDHDHDHPHDHDHGHDHGHGDEKPAANPPPSLPEDTGTQALAEALQSSFGIVKIAMVVLLIVFLGSGFFKVTPQERAVVLHMGKPSGTGKEVLLQPGLHFAWPYPIDEVVRIPYSQLMQVKSEVGWYLTTDMAEGLDQEGPGNPKLNPNGDGYVLSADQNIVHTRATLIYRIDEPITYQFDFVNASNTVQNDLDNALLYAASRFKVDDILTRDIVRFRDTVRERVNHLVQEQNLGIVIEQCNVQSKPPLFLKSSFDGVLTALSVRDKNHNEALSYQNQVLSKAEAEASGRINTAQADKVRLVESVKAEAQRFTDLLPGFRKNPSLFANVLLTETMGRVLTNVQDKIYIPARADGKTREVRLQLSREPAASANIVPASNH